MCDQGMKSGVTRWSSVRKSSFQVFPEQPIPLYPISTSGCAALVVWRSPGMRRPRRSLLSQVPADPHLTSLNFVPSAIIHIYGKLEDPIPQGLDCTSLYMSTITTLNPLCKCFETLVFQFKTHQKSDQLLPIFNKPNISQGMMLN